MFEDIDWEDIIPWAIVFVCSVLVGVGCFYLVSRDVITTESCVYIATGLQRCENNEVVCYKTDKGLQCNFKNKR